VDDGRAGGYDWAAVLAAVGEACGRRVFDVPVPRLALDAVAAVNAVAARLLGYSPMLTPGKVRELYHEDWVCRDRRFAERTGWCAQLPLVAGLRATFSCPR
jgi:phage baseplate assembly protein gpV